MNPPLQRYLAGAAPLASQLQGLQLFHDAFVFDRFEGGLFLDFPIGSSNRFLVDLIQPKENAVGVFGGKKMMRDDADALSIDL